MAVNCAPSGNSCTGYENARNHAEAHFNLGQSGPPVSSAITRWLKTANSGRLSAESSGQAAGDCLRIIAAISPSAAAVLLSSAIIIPLMAAGTQAAIDEPDSFGGGARRWGEVDELSQQRCERSRGRDLTRRGVGRSAAYPLCRTS